MPIDQQPDAPAAQPENAPQAPDAQTTPANIDAGSEYYSSTWPSEAERRAVDNHAGSTDPYYTQTWPKKDKENPLGDPLNYESTWPGRMGSGHDAAISRPEVAPQSPRLKRIQEQLGNVATAFFAPFLEIDRSIDAAIGRTSEVVSNLKTNLSDHARYGLEEALASPREKQDRNKYLVLAKQEKALAKAALKEGDSTRAGHLFGFAEYNLKLHKEERARHKMAWRRSRWQLRR